MTDFAVQDTSKFGKIICKVKQLPQMVMHLFIGMMSKDFIRDQPQRYTSCHDFTEGKFAYAAKH